jgi:hypothetical protein
MGSPPMTHSPPVELPEFPGARLLGDLARGGATWQVFVEVNPGTKPVRGRIHFVTDGHQRSTGWIFLEWSEADLIKRFSDFSALELWRLLESLG